MEIPENENALNTYETNIESNDNGTDEIEICSSCNISLVLCGIYAILNLWCPLIFYAIFIQSKFRKVFVIDKKNKTLIYGTKGIIKCCCSGCLYNRRTYFLDEIKHVMIQVICIDDNRVCSDKEYFINGYIYSQNNEYQPLFTNIEYTNKKYNKLVSFFQKYIHTI